jgi:hypothetical protein
MKKCSPSKSKTIKKADTAARNKNVKGGKMAMKTPKKK